MISGVSQYMEEKGFNSLQEMVGLAIKNIIPTDQFDRGYIVYPKFNDEKCVGCHLCANVCPVQSISKGEIVFKKGEKERNVVL